MRTAPGIVLQLAAASSVSSHISCVLSFFHKPPRNVNSNLNYHKNPQRLDTTSSAELTRALFLSGGGEGWRGREVAVQQQEEDLISLEYSSCSTKRVLWGWRRRARRAQQAEVSMTAAAAEFNTNSRAEKRKVLIKGLLRRLGRLLGAIVDFATLKRLRQLRQAHTVGA